MFPFSNRKSEHHRGILHIQISLGTKFQLKLTILIFWAKFAQKEYLQWKTEKVNITIEFWIFELVLVPNFTLNKRFWILEANLPKKGIFSQKEKNEHHHWILHIRNSLGIKFHFKQTILNFGTKLIQKGYFGQNKKSEHHHWILYIRIVLGTKFQLKLKILIFWTKFVQIGYFRSKTEKVNITIEFCTFELG